MLVGAVGGAAFVATQPVVHKAETRLAVASTDLSAQLVPGFALASQELASNYARYVNTEGAEEALAGTLGEPEDTVVEVVASPIPESNVVRIEVEATSADVAVRGAESVAADLMALVDRSRLDDSAAATALEQYTDLSQQVADAEQAVAAAQAAVDRALEVTPNSDVAPLRAQLAAAESQLDILSVQQQAVGSRYEALVAENSGTAGDLEVVRPAVSVGDDRTARLLRFGILGAALGGLLGVLAATLVERRRGRAEPQAVATPGGSSAVAPDPLRTSSSSTSNGSDAVQAPHGDPAGASEDTTVGAHEPGGSHVEREGSGSTGAPPAGDPAVRRVNSAR